MCKYPVCVRECCTRVFAGDQQVWEFFWLYTRLILNMINNKRKPERGFRHKCADESGTCSFTVGETQKKIAMQRTTGTTVYAQTARVQSTAYAHSTLSAGACYGPNPSHCQVRHPACNLNLTAPPCDNDRLISTTPSSPSPPLTLVR